jgi:hypothetical protein
MMTTEEIVDMCRVEAAHKEADGDFTEAAAFLINVAMLSPTDQSNKEWERILLKLPSTLTLLDELFEEMTRQADGLRRPDTVSSFIAALDTNFSMSLLSRALRAREASVPELIQFCRDRQGVRMALMNHATDRDENVAFFTHMCHAVDILLGTGFPPAQRATFYHNLALSYGSGTCTPTLKLVNEHLICAYQIACYEQSHVQMAIELPSERAACEQREIGKGQREMFARVMHYRMAELLMKQHAAHEPRPCRLVSARKPAAPESSQSKAGTGGQKGASEKHVAV